MEATLQAFYEDLTLRIATCNYDPLNLCNDDIITRRNDVSTITKR